MSPSLGLSKPTHHVDPNQREPLAVIGIGCRFPGGIDSPTAYWDALLRGLNAICDVPDDRWRHSRFHDTNSDGDCHLFVVESHLVRLQPQRAERIS